MNEKPIRERNGIVAVAEFNVDEIGDLVEHGAEGKSLTVQCPGGWRIFMAKSDAFH